MSAIVSMLGAVAAMIGLMGLVNPRYLVDLVTFWQGPSRFRLAVGVRLVLGIVLLAASPACRIPIVVQAIGVISIIAAFLLMVIGQARLDAFMAWWLDFPPVVMRASALFAFSFGALLFYVGG